MADEIQILHDDAAETVVVIIRNQAGEYCVVATPAFEAWDGTHWATYAITLAAVSGAYTTGNVALQGTFPALAAGFYELAFYQRAGATAAQTDAWLGSRDVYWNGTALQPAAIVALTADIDSTGVPITLAKAIEALLAWSAGKVVYNATTGVATYYGQDGETVVLTTPLLGGGNRDEPTIT